MTIRFLTAYGVYKANEIATLDAGTEAGLIANKLASLSLAGGSPYVPPVVPSYEGPADIFYLSRVQLTALAAGTSRFEYEVVDEPGRPRFRWDGGAFVASAGAAPPAAGVQNSLSPSTSVAPSASAVNAALGAISEAVDAAQATAESKASLQTGALAPNTSAAPNATAVQSAITEAISQLLNGAGGAFDTLVELAAALGNDANFAATVASSLAAKQAQLVAGVNIKTFGGVSPLGAGDIPFTGGTGGGAPSLIAFAYSLDLSGNKYSASQAVSSALTLTLAAGAVEGGSYRVTFVPDNASVITLGSGLVLASGSAAYSQTNRMTLLVEVIDGVAQAAWFVGALLAGGGGSVPAQVNGLRVTPGQARGATIPFDWTAVAGATSYIVEHQLPENSYEVHSIIAGSSVRFERLNPGETHGARITAVNAAGQAVASATVAGVVPTVTAAGFFDDFNVPDTAEGETYNPYPYSQYNILGGGLSPWYVKDGMLACFAADTAPRKYIDLGRKNTTITFDIKDVDIAEGMGLVLRRSTSNSSLLSLNFDGQITVVQVVDGAPGVALAQSPNGGVPNGTDQYLLEVTLLDNAGTWKLNGVDMPPFAIDPAVDGTIFEIGKYRSGNAGYKFNSLRLT